MALVYITCLPHGGEAVTGSGSVGNVTYEVPSLEITMVQHVITFSMTGSINLSGNRTGGVDNIAGTAQEIRLEIGLFPFGTDGRNERLTTELLFISNEVSFVDV